MDSNIYVFYLVLEIKTEASSHNWKRENGGENKLICTGKRREQIQSYKEIDILFRKLAVVTQHIALLQVYPNQVYPNQNLAKYTQTGTLASKLTDGVISLKKFGSSWEDKNPRNPPKFLLVRLLLLLYPPNIALQVYPLSRQI